VREKIPDSETWGLREAGNCPVARKEHNEYWADMEI